MTNSSLLAIKTTTYNSTVPIERRAPMFLSWQYLLAYLFIIIMCIIAGMIDL